MIIKVLAIGLLALVIASLGSSLYHLVKGGEDSTAMVRMLTWRIGLSVAAFALLMAAIATGLITPSHSLP